MRTRICYFAKFRPLMFTSDLLVDRCYFVVIKFIVFSVVVVSSCESTRKRQTTLFALWLPNVIRFFEGVMVCFTQASSCGATGGRRRLGQGTICLTAVDSVGVTSDDINRLLE